MKKIIYKNLAKASKYFSEREWQALIKLVSDDFGEPDRLRIKNNTLYAIYDGEVIGFPASYDEEADETIFTIPARDWKPLLISYGYIPKNYKIFFGKYINSGNYKECRRHFIKK